jgi:hypothetical protein
MTSAIGEGAQSGAEGTQSGAGLSTVAGEGTETHSEGAQSGTGETVAPVDSEKDRLAAELTKQRERALAADQRAAKTEAELKQLRDKDLPEAEKLKRDYEESQQQVVKLQETNGRLAAEVAFLKDNTYTWHDPATALKLLDMSQVTIEADGTAMGMKDALKALATSHPFLIKQEVKEEAKPPAGTSSGNNGSSASKPATKGLAQRFPAMQTRVKRNG